MASMREKARAKAKKSQEKGGGFLSMPEGAKQFRVKKADKFLLDVIPYRVSVKTHPEVDKGELWYQRTYYVHFNIGDNQAFICPKTIKKPCPICEYVKELYDSDDEDNIELAKSIKAKERELYNIIDLNNQDEGVQIFDYSYYLFGNVLDEEINEGPEEYGSFAELEGGYSLEISFRKKKLGKNSFFETRKIEFQEREEEYDEDIVESAHDLDKMLTIKDYDFLKKTLFELPEEDDNDNDDDDDKEDKEDKGGKKGGKKSSGKKSSSSKKSSDDDDDKGKKSSGGKKPVGGKSKTGKKSKDKSSDPECPGGGTFGVDVDDLDECEDCDHYVECQEKYEKDNG